MLLRRWPVMFFLLAASLLHAEPSPELWAKLSDERDGHYAAIELAEMGESVVPGVRQRLQDPNPNVRRYAARVLTNLGPEKPAAVAAGADLLAALKVETDRGARSSQVQAVCVLKLDPKDAVPALAKRLLEGDADEKWWVTSCIAEDYTRQAAGLKPVLVLNAGFDDRAVQNRSLRALQAIGIDEADAAKLAQAKVKDASEAAQEILRILLDYPALAKAYVESHPRLLASFDRDELAFIHLYAKADPKTAGLREFLNGRTDLPQFLRIDSRKGERVGFVETWPRKEDPRECFPQRVQVVRVTRDGAVVNDYATIDRYKLSESEGFIPLRIDDKWGAIDPAGKIVLPPAWDSIQPCQQGRMVVIVDNKYGIIDRDGIYILPPEYDWAYGFDEGVAAVKKGQKWGFIKLDGTWLIEPSFKRIDHLVGGWKTQTFDGKEDWFIPPGSKREKPKY